MAPEVICEDHMLHTNIIDLANLLQFQLAPVKTEGR